MDNNKKKKKTEQEVLLRGYSFLNQEDADKADADFHKIEYLDKHVPISKAEDIKLLYEKAIHSNIFGSPIGWHYLANCRDALIEAGYDEKDLIPIPIKTTIVHPTTITEEKEPKIVYKTVKSRFPIKLAFSLVLNLILIIVVVLMFIIASKSESDNIINYKNNITNRYAEWQQSLTERENIVRQKEKELGIEDTTDWLEENE